METIARIGLAFARGALAAFAVVPAVVAGTADAFAEAPRRVVSMNLCTDQLAILIAGEGQLVSVSHLARDPVSAVLWKEARSFGVNHGLAEEIFTLRPDLVLAGAFTARTSVALLRRLGFRVEEFSPPRSFDETREQMRAIGRLLGRDARAEALVAEMDGELEALAQRPLSRRPVAALHYANSYTDGGDTLASAVLEAAGLENLGARLGLSGTVRLPLEVLVVAGPDLVIGGAQPEEAPVLAYQTFRHPALAAVTRGRPVISVPDKYWVCGAPFTAVGARMLRDAAERALAHPTLAGSAP